MHTRCSRCSKQMSTFWFLIMLLHIDTKAINTKWNAISIFSTLQKFFCVCLKTLYKKTNVPCLYAYGWAEWTNRYWTWTLHQHIIGIMLFYIMSFFIYTSTKLWRGCIFIAVCMCVCVCLSVNTISTEWMHQFGRCFC